MILTQSVRLILQVIVEFILILFWITKATNLSKICSSFTFLFLCSSVFFNDFHVYLEFSYLFILIFLFYLLKNNHTKEGF